MLTQEQLTGEFENIARDTITKAERLDCNLPSFYAGLVILQRVIADRIELAPEDGVDMDTVYRDFFEVEQDPAGGPAATEEEASVEGLTAAEIASGIRPSQDDLGLGEQLAKVAASPLQETQETQQTFTEGEGDVGPMVGRCDRVQSQPAPTPLHQEDQPIPSRTNTLGHDSVEDLYKPDGVTRELPVSDEVARDREA